MMYKDVLQDFKKLLTSYDNSLKNCTDEQRKELLYSISRDYSKSLVVCYSESDELSANMAIEILANRLYNDCGYRVYEQRPKPFLERHKGYKSVVAALAGRFTRASKAGLANEILYCWE